MRYRPTGCEGSGNAEAGRRGMRPIIDVDCNACTSRRMPGQPVRDCKGAALVPPESGPNLTKRRERAWA